MPPGEQQAMRKPGVLLIHGLGGTQYDLGSLQKRLKNSGFVTHSLTLPGHGTSPENLIEVQVEDWIEAVRAKYYEVASQHEVLHIIGMCMGALLAIELAKRERHTKGKLVALAAPVYLDGWATPWYRGARALLYHVPGMVARMKVREEEPYGIKNEQLRGLIKAKLARGDNFHYQWVPLACIREVDRLRKMVMNGLHHIECQTLVIHAREDELTSLRSATYLVERIGANGRAGMARMIVLEDSYHMVCVDNDREIVVRSVLQFFDVTSVSSLAMGHIDANMSIAEIGTLLERVCRHLRSGDFAGVYENGIPEFVWLQPGANRTSGVYPGSRGLARLSEWAKGDSPLRFNALGSPSLNAGVAVVPATLTDGQRLASHGVLAFAVRAGRLLEARWFPDDIELEDNHFGGALVSGREDSQARAFADAVALSKSLKQLSDNDTLLALYSLYKQSTVGNVVGDRPSRTDLMARAKYDAWLQRKGMSAQAAMATYVQLVNRLHAAHTSLI